MPQEVILPAVGDIDTITGQPLDELEVAFRNKMIQQEGEYIAIDDEYVAYRAAIHQPLGDDEFGRMDEEGWRLERPVTALQLSLLPDDRGQESQETVVQLLKYFVGEFPAKVMHLLFEIANDPPFFRRPDIRVSINDLLDRLGYTRDSRGVHYSANRKKLTQTLLALSLTQVELRRTRGKSTEGYRAPLLASLGFLTNEDVRNMPFREVFAQGLADTVPLTINPVWYRGVRGADNRPGTHYKLLPRTTPEQRGRKRGAPRGHTQVRSGRSVDNLRVYIQRCQASTQARQVEIALSSLLQEAGITNRNISQALTTLRRALDKLVLEGVLTAHRQIQRGATAIMELRW
ncbi:MAG TPA: hypothetical protein VHB98_03495 [Chloroflexota bacterium]|jgi:hypothetical protein|nr:hypothetical protein [Chloroflexota bacterium]